MLRSLSYLIKEDLRTPNDHLLQNHPKTKHILPYQGGARNDSSVFFGGGGGGVLKRVESN